MSMVVDHYNDKWQPFRDWTNNPNPTPPPNITVNVPDMEEIKKEIRKIVKAELKEFKKLLERAKKYDEENNQPDCETEDKKKKIKDFADSLEIEIDFI